MRWCRLGELGSCIGDVYISTKYVFHGRRIPDGSHGDLEEYGTASLPSAVASFLLLLLLILIVPSTAAVDAVDAQRHFVVGRR